MSSGSNRQKKSAGGAADEPATSGAKQKSGGTPTTPSTEAAQRRAFLLALKGKFYTRVFKDKGQEDALFVFSNHAWHYGAGLESELAKLYAKHRGLDRDKRGLLGKQLVSELRQLKDENQVAAVAKWELASMRSRAERGIFYRNGSFVSMHKGAVGIQLPGEGGSVVLTEGGTWVHKGTGDDQWSLMNGKWKPLVFAAELQDDIGADCMTAEKCLEMLPKMWSSPWSPPPNAASGSSSGPPPSGSTPAPSFRHLQSCALGSDEAAKAFVLTEVGFIRGAVPLEGKCVVVFYSDDNCRGRLKTSVMLLQRELVSETLFAVSNASLAPEIMQYMTSESADPRARKKVRYHS